MFAFSPYVIAVVACLNDWPTTSQASGRIADAVLYLLLDVTEDPTKYTMIPLLKKIYYCYYYYNQYKDYHNAISNTLAKTAVQ